MQRVNLSPFPHSLFISSFSLHFIFIFSLSLHFLASWMQGCRKLCNPALKYPFLFPAAVTQDTKYPLLQIFLKTSLNAPLCYKMQDISDLCYSVTKLHAVTLNYSSLKQGNVSCSPLCLDFTAIQGGNKLPLIFHKNKCTAVILLAKFYRHICSNQPCLAIRNSNFLYTARALNVKVDQKKENEFS